MLSLFLRRFFLSLGQTNFFSVQLLRPFVSVINDFLKFFIFEVLKTLLKNYTSLRECSGLYAYAEHTRQELVRKLIIRARHRCAMLRMLSIRIRFPFFKRPFVIEVPTNHAEHTRKELVRMLSIRVRN
jgi:hypothetical protein